MDSVPKTVISRCVSATEANPAFRMSSGSRPRTLSGVVSNPSRS